MSRDYSLEATVGELRAEVTLINHWAERIFDQQVETNQRLEAILEELRAEQSRRSSAAAEAAWRDE